MGMIYSCLCSSPQLKYLSLKACHSMPENCCLCQHLSNRQENESSSRKETPTRVENTQWNDHPDQKLWFHHFQTQLSPEYGRNLPHIRSRHWLAQWNCWSPTPGGHGEQGRHKCPTPKVMQDFSLWHFDSHSRCILYVIHIGRWRTSATLPLRIVRSFDVMMTALPPHQSKWRHCHSPKLSSHMMVSPTKRWGSYRFRIVQDLGSRTQLEMEQLRAGCRFFFRFKYQSLRLKKMCK